MPNSLLLFLPPSSLALWLYKMDHFLSVCKTWWYRQIPLSEEYSHFKMLSIANTVPRLAPYPLVLSHVH